ncbi:GNAT family N-acetyltransferase [Pseudoalteromonas sp. NEC-BIFX-2020_015]|uniref:GNAT family N-acetyltransferase n=1 Tax=Pseudoalteromonas sp. NEC-BIFX-2020_015 TaxID=2729544 RepID=UPI00146136CB|nr:GNAT family N-acetyltransferase [Pseudoalteromonas sp. NEC-BIFX-2020_015]NMR24287.1 GNAT family N-acetyltransferase [Pseudoalteromonas sp. NEC-BIFX-2020_015]
MFTKHIHQTNKLALQPLTQDHLEGLYQAGQEPQIWRWVLMNYTQTRATLTDWFINTAQFNAEQQIVYAIVDKASSQVLGTTRLFRLDKQNRSAEIGHTFIGLPWQRSFVNSHAKYLLLQYAFDELGLARIAFNTHEQNQKSRNAIARLGARFEGISYKDRLLADGSYRNTAQFSIIDEQWPAIRSQLEGKL